MQFPWFCFVLMRVLSKTTNNFKVMKELNVVEVFLFTHPTNLMKMYILLSGSWFWIKTCLLVNWTWMLMFVYEISCHIIPMRGQCQCYLLWKTMWRGENIAILEPLQHLQYHCFYGNLYLGLKIGTLVNMHKWMSYNNVIIRLKGIEKILSKD